MAEQQETPPHLEALAQYIKDFSFENPNAPYSLRPPETPPDIHIDLDVTSRALKDGDYEVNLLLSGRAGGEGEDLLFRFELDYAGVYRPSGIPAEHLDQVLKIEGPRLMFPFARAIIANAVRESGFPPFMLQPVDFVGLYHAKHIAPNGKTN